MLEKIVSSQTKVNALHELLPWAWKAARPTPVDAAREAIAHQTAARHE